MAKNYLRKTSLNIFHFRIGVPAELQSILGKSEIKRSLKTSDVTYATKLAQVYAHTVLELFTKLRRGEVLTKIPMITPYTELKFDTVSTDAEGNVSVEGVELDPNNLEADVAALQSILGAQGSTKPKVTAKLLQDVVEDYCAEKKFSGTWKSKTESEYRASFSLMVQFFGNADISSLSAASANSFKLALMKLPPNYTKGVYQGLTVPQIIALKPPIKLSPTSVNKYLRHASTLFGFAKRHGYAPDDYFKGLMIKQAKRAHQFRAPWSRQNLQVLFGTKIFTARQGKKPYQYWVPLIGLLSGMRLDEICQLHLDDIRQDNGVWYFDVNDDAEKKVKNLSSRRQVPVHPVLIDKGLITFREILLAKSEDRLFPELQQRRDGYGQTVSKWFQRYRASLTLVPAPHSAKQDFHSFRHNVGDELKQLNEAPHHISAILGHEDPSITTSRYANPYSVKVLQPVIEKLDFSAITNGIHPY